MGHGKWGPIEWKTTRKRKSKKRSHCAGLRTTAFGDAAPNTVSPLWVVASPTSPKLGTALLKNFSFWVDVGNLTWSSDSSFSFSFLIKRCVYLKGFAAQGLRFFIKFSSIAFIRLLFPRPWFSLSNFLVYNLKGRKVKYYNREFWILSREMFQIGLHPLCLRFQRE